MQQESDSLFQDGTFKGDDLGDRLQIAQSIESLIEEENTREEGFVLSVNGEWGTGKTTFANMLTDYLKSKNYRVISFNCWKNDFVDDPLVSMFSQMTEVVKDNKGVLDKLVPLFGKIVLGGLMGAAKGFFGKSSEVVAGAISGACDVVKEDGCKLLDAYKEQTESMEQFSELLKEYVACIDDAKTKTTVVFIIDELDRCNPHYAVKVLERIKYLFDIPNVFFVLPISRSQLECSIKGYYGSDLIDANIYLRKFIDLEIKLSNTNLKDYCKKLFNNYGFEKYYTLDYKQGMIHHNCEAAMFFEGLRTDLRSIDKIMYHIGKVMKSGFRNDAFMPILLLTYLKFNERILYDIISKHDISVEALLDKFVEIFPNGLIKEDNKSTYHYLMKLIASFFVVYNHDVREDNNGIEDIIPTWNLDEGNQLSIVFNKKEIANEYAEMCKQAHLRNIRLDNLVKQIDVAIKY